MRNLVFMVALLAGCGAPPPQPQNSSAAAAEMQAVNSTVDSDRIDSTPSPPGAPIHPCLAQDGKLVDHKLKAIGTEPFWAADVEGRCVTYRTPEGQQGTRVWTHVGAGRRGPVWNGALRGRQFQLTVKAAPPPGCSDGMSDRTYPMDAELRVDGEVRKGCAAPL